MEVEVGGEASEGSSDADLEGVRLALLVAASIVGLCEGLVALNDRVVEDWIDDDSLSEDLTVAESILVLWEGLFALNDTVVDGRIDDESILEDLGDVAGVAVDVVLGVDEVDETSVEDDSIPDSVIEDIEDLVNADVILELLDTGEEKDDATLTVEEVSVVGDVSLRLDEVLVERGNDDEAVPEDMGDTIRVDDDVTLELLEVGEDNIDGISTLEDVEDVAVADFDLKSVVVEAMPDTVDDDSLLEDIRDVADVVVDVFPKLGTVLEIICRSEVAVMVCVSEPGVVLVGNEEPEEEKTTELGLGPKIAANIEDTNSEPLEGEVDEGLALDGGRDGETPKEVPRPDRVPERGLALWEDELICELKFDG